MYLVTFHHVMKLITQIHWYIGELHGYIRHYICVYWYEFYFIMYLKCKAATDESIMTEAVEPEVMHPAAQVTMVMEPGQKWDTGRPEWSTKMSGQQTDLASVFTPPRSDGEHF